MGKSTDATHRVVQGFAALGFLVLVYLQILGGNPFPWSDEWALIPPAIGAQPLSWEWLWAQHVDHRLPIQKLFQVLLLKASVVDFRILVFANAVLAYLATTALLASIRSYRGRSHLGDALVPLILLNPGFMPFEWGFQFQFLSSVVLTLCILALLLRDTADGGSSATALGATCALLLAFCGLNGAIFATVLSAGLLARVRSVTPLGDGPGGRGAALLLALPLLAVLVVVLTWTPSSASGWNDGSGLRRIGERLPIVFSLIHARSWAPPPGPPAIYFAVDWLLYASAIGLLGARFWGARKTGPPIDSGLFGMAVVMLATVIVLLGVAIGRTKDWSSGVRLHYGYLATILPVVAWIVVSTQAPRKIAAAAGVALVLIFAGTYARNVELKREQFLQRRQDFVRIAGDLGAGMSVKDFVGRNNRYFFHVDDEKTRRPVERAVSLLRTAGVQPWGRLAP